MASKDPNAAYVVDELIVPGWYAERIAFQKKLIAQLRHKKLLQTDAAYREEWERKRKDTKPLFYQNRSDPNRPIIVVGGGGMWFKDMQEKAERLREKPNPALDPENKRDPKVDVADALDRRLRADRGARTFHIKNNPVAEEKS